MPNKAVEGHYRCYVPKKFGSDSLKIIEAANHIIDEYARKGFTLTLRQIYYQFVQRIWLQNQEREYKRLGDIISDARMAGLISWTAIEDRNRALISLPVQKTPAGAARHMRKHYRLDKWKDQRFRPEVWVEKAALEGVVEIMCNRLQVDFFSCRGYNSQSEQWRAGQRFGRYVAQGQTPIVFHFGDHDPSGIDMTRDNKDRLAIFAGMPVMVQRLALNWPQIEEFRPPPNPAKTTDSRFKSYRERFGKHSWELDALNPEVLHDLIKEAVLKIRDEAAWARSLDIEAEHKRMLDETVEMLGGEPYIEGDDDDDLNPAR